MRPLTDEYGVGVLKYEYVRLRVVETQLSGTKRIVPKSEVVKRDEPASFPRTLRDPPRSLVARLHS